MPPDLSTHGAGIDQLIYVIHIFMVVLFVAWGIFLLYCLFKYRKRPGRSASYQSNTSKLPKYAEIGVVLVEVFLLVGLSFPIWSRYKRDFPDPKNSLEVRVLAQQFVWNIHYPGEDKKFGRADSQFMSDSNPLGIDPKDPASADDFFTVNQFHFPVDKPVIAYITSKDVIHSFGVPVLRLKQDAVPGLTVPIHFAATRAGAFEIICSQLCGNGHSLMKGNMSADKPEDFEKWSKEQPRPFKPAEAAGHQPDSKAGEG
jgi:cytochrome c oxidase subunit 2